MTKKREIMIPSFARAQLVIVLATLLIASGLHADPPINPIPRAVKTTTLHTWDFDGGES
jgi:hypothetical protein